MRIQVWIHVWNHSESIPNCRGEYESVRVHVGIYWWINFESFLNPLLYVSFDFTNQIPADTERCKVQRFILNIDTTNQQNVWNAQLNKANNLDYVNFFNILLNNNITYFLDEDVIDLPPREIRFFGDFTTQRVFDDLVESEVDGVTTQKRRFRFQLNTLNYNDSTSEFTFTQQLSLSIKIIKKIF